MVCTFEYFPLCESLSLSHRLDFSLIWVLKEIRLFMICVFCFIFFSGKNDLRAVMLCYVFSQELGSDSVLEIPVFVMICHQFSLVIGFYGFVVFKFSLGFSRKRVWRWDF